MTTHAARGFTIIEVVLFLAVTGLLGVGILLGSSATIAQQRYRDSVSSLKGFIQEQYSQTINVVNSEQENPQCTRQSNTLSLDSGTPRARGTSECLLLGRYVLIEPTKVTAHDVLGQATTDTEGTDDIDALNNYALRITDPVDSKEIAWGAMVVRPNTTTGLTTSLLVLRSPLSGSIVTFVSEGNQSPSAMIATGNMEQKDLCVDSQAGVITSQRLAVRINAQATSQSSIEIPLETDTVCG